MDRVVASGVSRPSRFHQFITFSSKVDPNTYVNLITRMDDCTKDREAERHVVNYFPDKPTKNRVIIREDYGRCKEHGKYGWYPPVLTITDVNGSLSPLMKNSIKTSYKFVKIVRFNHQFSSVFAMMTLVSSLENCREVCAALNPVNIEKSEVDIYSEVYGILPFAEAVHSNTVKKISVIVKPSDIEILRKAGGVKSRVNTIVKLGIMMYSNIQEIAVSSFGTLGEFRQLNDLMISHRSRPPTLLPHVNTFEAGKITMKVDVRNIPGQRAPRPVQDEIAPEHPPYMEGNEEFLYMGYFKDKKVQAARKANALSLAGL